MLSQFAPVLLIDGVTDLAPAIDDALQLRGACIALADVYGGHSDSGDTATVAKGTITVFAYDNPNVHHVPGGTTLVEAIVVAMTQRHDFQLHQWERLTNEKGGTLTILEFQATIVFNG